MVHSPPRSSFPSPASRAFLAIRTSECLMTMSDSIYRPFERMIRPLDIPYRRYRARPIRFSCTSSGCSRRNHRDGADLDDGGGRQPDDHLGAFRHRRRGHVSRRRAICRTAIHPTGRLAFLIFPFCRRLLHYQYSELAHDRHQPADRHPVAGAQGGGTAGSLLLHDLFAGQVASRLNQVAQAVQQQILIAFQTAPRFCCRLSARSSCFFPCRGNWPCR